MPLLYRQLLGESFFTFDDALKLVGNRHRTQVNLYRLIREGYVRPVKRRLYQVVPVEYRDKEPPFDKFLLGRMLVSPYYFSHHSALEIHGVSNAELFNLVYVSSPRQFRGLSYRSVEYVWVRSTKLFGVEDVIWSDKVVHVSDRERTLLDCLQRVDLAGGFEEAYKSLVSFPSVNFDRLYRYLEMMSRKSLFYRLGFFLSVEDVRSRWRVPDEFLEKVKRMVGEKTYYFATKKGRGRLVRDWNLVVPENVEALMSYG